MSIWADRNIHQLLADVKDLKERLLAVESRPSEVNSIQSTEPADKRTKEWREWRERQTSN